MQRTSWFDVQDVAGNGNGSPADCCCIKKGVKRSILTMELRWIEKDKTEKNGTSLVSQVWKNVWKTSGSSESSSTGRERESGGGMGVWEKSKDEDKEEREEGGKRERKKERVRQEMSLWLCPLCCQKPCGHNTVTLSFLFGQIWNWQLKHYRKKKVTDRMLIYVMNLIQYNLSWCKNNKPN